MKFIELHELIELARDRGAGDNRIEAKVFSFFLGSGASRASGIATGAELAKNWLNEIEPKRDELIAPAIFNKFEKDPARHYPKYINVGLVRKLRALSPTTAMLLLSRKLKKAILPKTSAIFTLRSLSRKATTGWL